MSSKKSIFKLLISSMFLGLALVLPLIFGQIPQIGNMLCPMHIPILLCAYFVGPYYAAIVGLIAPLLRFLIFGMPLVLPTGVSMAFELFTYGIVAGILYIKLKKNSVNVYFSLICAMLCGRIVWGIVSKIIYNLLGMDFTFKMFITAGFIKAIPGIIVQIIFIPILVISINGIKKREQ